MRGGLLEIIGFLHRAPTYFEHYLRGMSETHTLFSIPVLPVFLFFLVPDEQVSRCSNERCGSEREYGVVSECGEYGECECPDDVGGDDEGQDCCCGECGEDGSGFHGVFLV